MKILLVSDSHLYNETLKNIIDKYPDVDYKIHCGDSSLDINDHLLSGFLVVRGNHDNDSFSINKELKINQYNCLITHGNKYNIYAGYDDLYDFMRANDYDICFHGHTHVPNFVKFNDKLFINPGSTMINRGIIGHGTYAIVTIDTEFIVEFYNSETLEKVDFNIIKENSKILEEFKKIIGK